MARPLDQYVNKVRMYLRDFKQKNKLLEDDNGNPRVENTNEEIQNAIEFVYYDAVQAPPVKMNIPLSEMSAKIWFLWGVVAFLLDSNAIENSRNALAVSDGGATIDPETYKVSTYSNIAINLWTKYTDGLTKDKIRFNYENFYSGSQIGTDPYEYGLGAYNGFYY